jgi:SAM-dependent methyltransferase
MTAFELGYLAAEPFLPPLYSTVRKRLLAFVRSASRPVDVLDVGGRKSHYTIGVPARVLVSELLRTEETQKRLNLGLTEPIVQQILRRRTNIENIVFDNMTASTLESERFDCVVAVEVLEHVQQDHKFVEGVHRVLRRNGLFLMTTPNGDAVPNTNPDHQRHYTREQLHAVLSAVFPDVQVDYAVAGGRFHDWGLGSWSLKRPVSTWLSMAGNVVNAWQSKSSELRDGRVAAMHLIAVARK